MTRVVAGRYELEEQIGEGGSARVYSAVDLLLRRRVAVKLLNAGLADPAGRKRFLREGPTSAAFLHRHAVTVFDAGEDSGELFIVMELIDGPSLAQHLTANGSLDVVDAVRIATQVLGALGAAHAAGIVHRDVKPANILLSPGGDAKLADFGISKRFEELEDSVTRSGITIGTPRYLTPEQAQGAPLSPATDVYAMGVVLFEMLTGRTPFTVDSPVTVALAQQSRPAPDVRDFRAEVPPSIAAALARSLEKDPADRFAAAAEMAAALSPAWSAPCGPLPQSALQTQLIGDPTAVWFAEPDTTVAPRIGRPRWRRLRPVPSAFAALVVLIAIGLAVQAALDEPGGLAGVETSATDTLPDDAPPSFEPPTATTATPATDIIAGFPETDDLRVFLRQLQADPMLVGTAGRDLAKTLERVLDEKAGKRQRERAAALQDQLVKWVDDGTLDPDIADALADLLTPLIADEGR